MSNVPVIDGIGFAAAGTQLRIHPALGEGFVARVVGSVAGVADVAMIADNPWPVIGKHRGEKGFRQRGGAVAICEIEQRLLLAQVEAREVRGRLPAGDFQNAW